MAIVQVLIAAISKQASKLLNTAFGWATTMLFGKVPADKQKYLSLISFGSVLWLVVVAGIAFPRVGTFLLTFIPLPKWVDTTWIRIAMLAAAILIPLAVGFLSTKLASEKVAGQREGTLKTILRGYPATFGLALTLILMTIFAPMIYVRRMIKRWDSAHVPVIVESHEYLTVVQEVQDALESEGIETDRQQASWMIRMPTKLLTSLASGTVQNLVADELTVLKSSTLEVLLHPADLVITGKEQDVDTARAVLADRMMFADANLTWTKEANDIEDHIVELWDELETAPRRYMTTIAPRRLAAIERELHDAKLSFDEWQVLSRAVMAVDRSLLAVAAGAIDRPRELLDGDERLGSARLQTEENHRENTVVRALSAAAVAGMALIARKTPEGRELLRTRDLIDVARLGVQASRSEPKAS
jgi:hypothetical protein